MLCTHNFLHIIVYIKRNMDNCWWARQCVKWKQMTSKLAKNTNGHCTMCYPLFFIDALTFSAPEKYPFIICLTWFLCVCMWVNVFFEYSCNARVSNSFHRFLAPRPVRRSLIICGNEQSAFFFSFVHFNYFIIQFDWLFANFNFLCHQHQSIWCVFVCGINNNENEWN